MDMVKALLSLQLHNLNSLYIYRVHLHISHFSLKFSIMEQVNTGRSDSVTSPLPSPPLNYVSLSGAQGLGNSFFFSFLIFFGYNSLSSS